MKIKMLIEPPENWQDKINAYVEFNEKYKESKHKCDFCSSNASFFILPEIIDESVYSPQFVKKDWIGQRIINGISKIFKNRYICSSPECRRKFLNETRLKISRKTGYEIL
jgi:hypothetical protein